MVSGAQTMIGLMSIPAHASLPDLLMTIASSTEFDSIKLRRAEKKALNAVNKSHGEGRIRYCVPNPAKPEKHKERISTGPEKIFILVSRRTPKSAHAIACNMSFGRQYFLTLSK